MWKLSYERRLDLIYLGPMFTDESAKILISIFKDRPTRVDYLVERWHSANDEHKKLLYFAILCGVPILECLEWGVKNDDFEYEVGVDEDLSDFKFEYLDASGRAKFMSWEEYYVWLAEQNVKEGDFLEKQCEFPNGWGEVDFEVLEKLKGWGYM